jgi:hypothetical protein
MRHEKMLHDMKMFNRIVKALKDLNFKATVHMNDHRRITIALGRDYFEHGYDAIVETELKLAGIQKGYYLPEGISIMAENSDIGDKEYTIAQYDIRGGI